MISGVVRFGKNKRFIEFFSNLENQNLSPKIGKF